MIAESYWVRRAETGERRRVMRLLPPGSAERDADIFVASENGGKELVGGAVTWFVPNRHFAERAQLIVHVLAPHRRRGIGRSLLHSAVAAARETGVKRLETFALGRKE